VIACCDSQPRGEVERNCPDGGFESERCPKSLDATVDRNANDEDDVEPVDMLVPVRPRNGSLCDMLLLWLIFGVSVRFGGFGHGGWL